MKNSVLKRSVVMMLAVMGATISSLAFADANSPHAPDGSSVRPPKVVSMQLQPTTSTSAESTKTIQAAKGGQLSCPVGYALTSVSSKSQEMKNVKVYTKCNGTGVTAGPFGIGVVYVHSWCQNGAQDNMTVSNAPTVTYTCQKIENTWVANK